RGKNIVKEDVGLRPIFEKDKLFRFIKGGPLIPTAKSRDHVLSDRTREQLVQLVQRLFLSPEADGPNVVVFSAVRTRWRVQLDVCPRRRDPGGQDGSSRLPDRCQLPIEAAVRRIQVRESGDVVR